MNIKYLQKILLINLGHLYDSLEGNSILRDFTLRFIWRVVETTVFYWRNFNYSLMNNKGTRSIF